MVRRAAAADAGAHGRRDSRARDAASLSVNKLLDWVGPQARIVGGYFFHTVNDLCLQGRWDEAQEILKGNDVWYAHR